VPVFSDHALKRTAEVLLGYWTQTPGTTASRQEKQSHEEQSQSHGETQMTLTLEIPDGLDTDRRKLLADALSKTGLLTSAQAAELLTVPSAGSSPLRQGSPEWKALLYRKGSGQGVILSPEATSREVIYGDDAR